MAMDERIALVVALVLGFVSMVAAVPGTATIYTPITPPACFGFPGEGVMIAAASDVIWDNGTACGRMYSVTCTGPTNQHVPQPCKGTSVVVQIVDYCPPPSCQATFELSQEAFAIIADPNAGKIKIDYTQV